MKISKSKQELARIISENGGWHQLANLAFYGNFTGECFMLCTDEYPIYDPATKVFYINGRDVVRSFKSKPFKNWHQTILSHTEYFHLYPAPDADGWIKWKSKFYGDIPCDENCIVDIMESDGGVFTGFIAKNWKHWGSVKAYRLHKPEQAKPEFCESVTRSIPGPSDKPTIEQLAADYRNAKDYADRKQSEADAAKADADARLKALELASEALGLFVSPITTKQEPEMVITDWRDLQVGDIIEYVDGDIKDKIGMTGPVVEFAEDDSDGMTVRLKCDNGPNKGRLGWPRKWRFIRRP